MLIDFCDVESARAADRLAIALRVLASEVLGAERPRRADAQALRAMADDDAERELPPHVLALRIAQREIELLRFIRTALRKQGLNDFSYPDIYRRNDNINAAV